MYVRINQAKFPNKMAKQAIQKHAKTTLSSSWGKWKNDEVNCRCF